MLTATQHKKLENKAHLHACTEADCRVVFEDRCDTPALNGRCQGCRTGNQSVWVEARLPRPCCTNSLLVTDRDVWLRFILGGPGPWFKCPTCARVHPTSDPNRSTQPKEETT